LYDLKFGNGTLVTRDGNFTANNAAIEFWGRFNADFIAVSNGYGLGFAETRT
jgi:hypothetical protein